MWEAETKEQMKIVEGYISSYEDIKKNDREWDSNDGIKNLTIIEYGREKHVGMFNVIMLMIIHQKDD